MLYSEWLDQDLVVRIQNKSPPIIFSLASLGFGLILRPDKYNKSMLELTQQFINWFTVKGERQKRAIECMVKRERDAVNRGLKSGTKRERNVLNIGMDIL